MLTTVPLIFALLTAEAGSQAVADGGAQNTALPPPKDKTTAPHDVDPAGNPRTQDRSALPEELSDIPDAPPSAAPVPKSTSGTSGTSGSTKPPTGGGARRSGDIK